MKLAIGIPPDERDQLVPHVNSEGRCEVSDNEQLVPPRMQTIYQQLHNYPVGSDAGVSDELAMGRKNNITPVRREFLSDVRAIIGVDAGVEIEARIRAGLRGELNAGRYGLPFLGDNSFLLDRLEERATDQKAFWYEPLKPEADIGARAGTTRLTVWIDRADMSKTVSSLYAPAEAPTPLAHIPGSAWISIVPPMNPA